MKAHLLYITTFQFLPHLINWEGYGSGYRLFCHTSIICLEGIGKILCSLAHDSPDIPNTKQHANTSLDSGYLKAELLQLKNPHVHKQRKF